MPLVGVMGGGSRRWLRFGLISLQPSEFMKLGLVIARARVRARTPTVHLDLREAMPALLMTSGPVAIANARFDYAT